MKNINQISSMPKMGLAFNGWQNTITLKIITQTVTNGLITQQEVTKTFKGVIQPLSPKEINLKPEGQRAFAWLQIHCFSGDLNLNVNDRIFYNNKTYKLMAILDYSLNNYIEYHLTEDFV